ncbi:hypothetical protein QUA30_04190 [Microcoleus sp. Pol14C2]|uniref:hypothetical protein n=1 Tax=unclassified Microcoleus TaxID=2642155 RepID=UPI002FD316FA
MLLLLIINQYCLDSRPAQRLRFVQLAIELNPASSDTGVAARVRAWGQKAKFSRAFLGGRIESLKIPFFSEIKKFRFFAIMPTPSAILSQE